MSLQTGTKLGPYEILAPLGAGGMGEVYKARDPKLDRMVAIKVLPEHLAKDADALARFEREAKALAALSHPNILGIFDFGTQGETAYAVMELLEGETLRVLISRGPLDGKRAAAISAQVAQGLAAAHAKGVIHRDLKPENVFLLKDGRVKLLDFGLAKRLDLLDQEAPTTPVSEALTQQGMTMGSPGYMAPEQIRGEETDSRSDVFAFGCVVLELYTGMRAFPGATCAEAMANSLKAAPQGLGQVPMEVQALLSRCLEKSPSRRWPDAQALIEALDRTPVEGSHALPFVAVLPFRDLSPGQDQAYFCEGIAEEILCGLSRLEGLRVASRAYSFRFRQAEDALRMGQELGIETLLQGSVRKSGDRLRISVQLVETGTGIQRWSHQSDHQLHEVFEAQETIARKVAKALSVGLSGAEAALLKQRPTEDPEAFDCYLRARQAFYRGRKSDMVLAADLYRRALELDPGFAKAHAGLADALTWLYQWHTGDPQVLEAAKAAAAIAVELDPGSASALAAYGHTLSAEKQFAEAREMFDRAIAKDPECFEALYYAARAALNQGDSTAVVSYCMRASKVDPADYQCTSLMSMGYDAMKNPSLALEADQMTVERARRHIETHPHDARALLIGACSLGRLQKREEALEWLGLIRQEDLDDASVVYNLSCNYALLGDLEKSIALLERVSNMPANHDWASKDPDLVNLHGHPRFRELMGWAKED